MPLIEVTLAEGRSPEKLRALISRLTEAVVETGVAPKQSVRVIVREVPPTHWAAADETPGRTGRKEAAAEHLTVGGMGTLLLRGRGTRVHERGNPLGPHRAQPRRPAAHKKGLVSVHKDIIVRQLPNFINGEFVETGNTFDILYPITGEVTAQAHKAGQKEVDAAVTAARAALEGPWGKLAQAERSKMVSAIADGVMKRFDDFLEAEVPDTGKPYSLASHVDIPRGAANFRRSPTSSRTHATESFQMDTPTVRRANYAIRQPVASSLSSPRGTCRCCC